MRSARRCGAETVAGVEVTRRHLPVWRNDATQVATAPTTSEPASWFDGIGAIRRAPPKAKKEQGSPIGDREHRAALKARDRPREGALPRVGVRPTEDARGLSSWRAGDSPMPLRVLLSAPLPRRQRGQWEHPAQFPRARGMASSSHMRVSTCRPGFDGWACERYSERREPPPRARRSHRGGAAAEGTELRRGSPRVIRVLRLRRGCHRVWLFNRSLILLRRSPALALHERSRLGEEV